MPQIYATENQVYHRCRAKYVPTSDGTMKLAQVQYFDCPKFTAGGWEAVDKFPKERGKVEELAAVGGDIVADAKNIERASRRAKINAFDMVLCNHDLDVFATFTYRPENGLDKASYDDCYKVLKTWLSNRVQRRGLKYVIVPERHKSGDIHFHGIVNSSAVDLVRATSPYTGKPLTHNGEPIFNIPDWSAGFTTAQIIGGGVDDREKVSKYIFKYMGKQAGQRIGGRYALIGGDMVRPTYIYGDTVEELVGDTSPLYERNVEVTDKLHYRELSFI